MRRHPAVALALASAMIVGACASGAASVAPAASPAPSPDRTAATATPTTAPSSTPAASLPASTAFTSWTPIDMPIAVPGTYPGNLPTDVTVFNDRLIAVGGANGGCCDATFSKRTRAIVWLSQDARDWRLAPESDVFDLGQMVAVAATAKDIVAVGMLNLKSEQFPGGVAFTPAVWTSQDGEQWTLVRDVPAFVDVVTGPKGFLAVAQTDAGPEIWASASGSEWAPVAGASDLGSGEDLRLVATELGYLLLGVEFTPPSVAKGIVWYSTDGASWNRVPRHEAFMGARFEDAAAIGDRLVVVGGDDAAPDIAWTSVDGMSWAGALGVANGTITNAIVANDALLVTGLDWKGVDRGPAPMASWTTNDGVTWHRVPDVRVEVSPGHEINALVAWGERIVAVGFGPSANPGELYRPGAWIVR